MDAAVRSKEVAEVLKRAVEAIELAMRVLQSREFRANDGALFDPYCGMSMLERIRVALKDSRGRGLTPNEIAAIVGGSPGAVRMNLYQHQDRLFRAERISPRLIRWTLIDGERPENTQEMNEAHLQPA